MSQDQTKIGAVLVAAGAGTRAGGTHAKQWQILQGRQVIDWSLEMLANHPLIDAIVVVTDDEGLTRLANHPLSACFQNVLGGARRDLSVRAGLDALEAMGATHVLIHDAARPGLSGALVDRVIAAMLAHGAAAPGLPVTDALWRASDDGNVNETVSRERIWRAQTPQAFALHAILAAHQRYDGPAADDVEMARASGIDVALVKGEEANDKLTYPEDFARLAMLMGRTKDRGSVMRIGNGFDVHRFGPGDHVVLCGVNVPHHRGLQGHSDADVGMHALTDAIYGALAEGDIGQHFPPSDPQWRGADSANFLRHAMERVSARGMQLANADVTLICEHPKIGLHSSAMRHRLAEIMGVHMDDISVKATTSERLGFTGRGEGIAAQASVLLVAS